MLQLREIFVLLVVEIANPHGKSGDSSPIPTLASLIPTAIWITLSARLAYAARTFLWLPGKPRSGIADHACRSAESSDLHNARLSVLTS